LPNIHSGRVYTQQVFDGEPLLSGAVRAKLIFQDKAEAC
jgi:hypothetical protein